MSVPLIINGITYNYPVQFDKNWGPTLTAWSTAVTNGMLQKSGGSFPLTAEIDFGSSFGMKVLSIKSEESNIAVTGILRLANASTGIVWRNALNSADLALTVNASNQLTFNGTNIGATTSLTNGHILVGNASNQPADVAMSGDTTITNAGVITIANNAITDAKVSSSAAIALSKLASSTAYYWYAANGSGVLTPLIVTASKAIISDANGLPSASNVTPTELGYVSGVTSSIQTQLNAINSVPSGTLVDFAGTAAPSGWLVCDGSAISRTTYAALFAVIGTTWGAGDGSTTFNIPALSRKTTVGSGGVGTGVLGNAVGNTGGAESVTPTQVAHTHTSNSHTHSMSHRHGVPIGDAGGATGVSVDPTAWGQGTVSFSSGSSVILNWGTSTTSGTVTLAKSQANDTADTGIQSDTGMSNTTAINNASSVIQPSAVVLKIIKT